MAFGLVVDPLTFYERRGRTGYDLVIKSLRWAGPMDMHDVLRSVKLKGATVADIAMGSGQLSPIFRRAGAKHVIGIDGSQDFLAAARAKNAADEYIRADVLNHPIPLANETVDLATCSGLFSYMADPSSLAYELVRITKTGGHVAVNYHPADEGAVTETITASTAIGSTTPRAAVLQVFRHPPLTITAMFGILGCFPETARFNSEGIRRAEDNSWVPLATALFRKDYAVPLVMG